MSLMHAALKILILLNTNSWSRGLFISLWEMRRMLKAFLMNTNVWLSQEVPVQQFELQAELARTPTSLEREDKRQTMVIQTWIFKRHFLKNKWSQSSS